MTLTATIRRAVAADARAIARVHVDSWRSAYAGILPDRVMVDMSVDEKAAFWRRMVLRTGTRESVLVASVTGSGGGSGEIVGFASCGPSDRGVAPRGGAGAGMPGADTAAAATPGAAPSARPAEPGPAGFDGEIHTLYVLPDWQEQGLGRGLLNAGFRALRRGGFNSAVVWVLAQNPSRFFYEAMGGRRVGERMESLWGTQLREIAYGWPDLEAVLARSPDR